MSEAVASMLESKDELFPRDCYHKYQKNCNPMLEYHVDTHPLLHKYIPKEMKCFSGCLSIRKKEEEKPLIIIGQDECTFH